MGTTGPDRRFERFRKKGPVAHARALFRSPNRPRGSPAAANESNVAQWVSSTGAARTALQHFAHHPIGADGEQRDVRRCPARRTMPSERTDRSSVTGSCKNFSVGNIKVVEEIWYVSAFDRSALRTSVVAVALGPIRFGVQFRNGHFRRGLRESREDCVTGDAYGSPVTASVPPTDIRKSVVSASSSMNVTPARRAWVRVDVSLPSRGHVRSALALEPIDLLGVRHVAENPGAQDRRRDSVKEVALCQKPHPRSVLPASNARARTLFNWCWAERETPGRRIRSSPERPKRFARSPSDRRTRGGKRFWESTRNRFTVDVAGEPLFERRAVI